MNKMSTRGIVQATLTITILHLGLAEINILFLQNSLSPKTAQHGIEEAFKYVHSHIQGFSGNITSVLLDDEPQLAKKTFCASLFSMVKSGHPPSVILDNTATGKGNAAILRLANTLQLPTVSVSYEGSADWRNLTDEEANGTFKILLPIDVATQIVPIIVTTFNTTTLAVLYEEGMFGSMMKQKYISWFANIPVSFTFLKIDDKMTDLASRLKEMLMRGITSYFLLGRSEFLDKVLMAANESSMFIHSVSWYAVGVEDKVDIKLPCRRPHCDIIIIQPYPDQEEKLNALVLDYPKLKSKNLFEAVFFFDLTILLLTAAHKLKSTNRWPADQSITCKESGQRGYQVSQQFRQAVAEVLHQPSYGPFMFSVNPVYQKMSHRIYKTEKLYSNKQSRLLIGYWTPGNLSVLNENAFVQHLPQSVYRVVTFVSPPFVYRNASTNNSYYGYCIDLLDALKDILNFEYHIYEEALEHFVPIDDDQQYYDGVLGELVKKNADIAVGPLAIMAEREHFVDFTLPFYDLVGINLLMRKPSSAPSLFRFLTVLEGDVWGCILAAYFVTSFLLWLFDRFSPYSYQNNKEEYVDDDEKREFNLKECLWFCMTSLTPQGGGEAPKNLSGRLIAASWWLFGFIIIASYTANLAAFLTVSRLESSIGGLDDLASQYKIKYAPVNGSSAMTYFERMAHIEEMFYQIWKRLSLNDSLSRKERTKLAVWDYPVSDKYSKIWEDMKEAKMPKTFDEGMERVQNPGDEEFILIAEANQVRYAVMINCDLMSVGDEFSRKPYALAVQKGSPLKDELALGILKLQSQRKLETFKERWWSQNPDKKNCEEEDNRSEGISIRNIGGVFIVILIGIGLACLMLAAEYFWYRVYKAPSRKISPSVSKTRPSVVQNRTQSVPKRTLPARRCVDRNRSYYYGF